VIIFEYITLSEMDKFLVEPGWLAEKKNSEKQSYGCLKTAFLQGKTNPDQV